ncbi:LSU ribosomal protein L18P [Candidatus Kryptonium thompsonii]|jgi:large subunit ribosomal protein L18|uniref:Large ribosomal subunit protein uL18 n=1 Tax=Candidatus Kryptonium thompsonii TaxID=1633631 RepID=A0A0P1P1K5_9BACT|nr:50S ribosomal protein L18 [Candidatus Kryptonium thompsoni]CUS76693.1 LSU ribosomal protein L18P [Candidatus Kryptonium thompsoni]CUS77800.1 LSU ribosomal protein L18P [Candidatus Kryptonium thompsoni]CUS78168.1 LSU ribosomal protein L18P [Candidatus Kryptonium thompsoni]CUS81532.1 LSU ribosomal protein L18P [Candidatus Kryptonium thompsoni]CUS83479.1 LSU ribosomal protein L18P [Candidatus Kryptonium thompsoni]
MIRREFEKKKIRREKIRKRVRSKIFGTPERPRLSVYRSLKHIYAQIIDDTKGHTLVAMSSLSKEIRDEVKNCKTKTDVSRVVGLALAKKALEKGITKVVFDRNGYKYHGRVKALAEAAREGGLIF